MGENFPRRDVRPLDHYLPGSCSECGRLRLIPFVDGPEGDERFVGAECEKCHTQWLLDPEQGRFHHPLSDDNPLRPQDNNDPLGDSNG